MKFKKKEEFKINPSDIGMAEDMISLIKQLVCAENHAALSVKSDPKKWMEVLDITRKIRTKYLAMVSKKENNEIWCYNKHILAASENLIEVANRFNQVGKKKEAEEALNDCKELISLFLILNGYKEGKEVLSEA